MLPVSTATLNSFGGEPIFSLVMKTLYNTKHQVIKWNEYVWGDWKEIWMVIWIYTNPGVKIFELDVNGNFRASWELLLRSKISGAVLLNTTHMKQQHIIMIPIYKHLERNLFQNNHIMTNFKYIYMFYVPKPLSSKLKGLLYL